MPTTMQNSENTTSTCRPNCQTRIAAEPLPPNRREKSKKLRFFLRSLCQGIFLVRSSVFHIVSAIITTSSIVHYVAVDSPVLFDFEVTGCYNSIGRRLPKVSFAYLPHEAKRTLIPRATRQRPKTSSSQSRPILRIATVEKPADGIPNNAARNVREPASVGQEPHNLTKTFRWFGIRLSPSCPPS
jgi:hypothetical protein